MIRFMVFRELNQLNMQINLGDLILDLKIFSLQNMVPRLYLA